MNRRTSEIGIRIALGAAPVAVMRLVLAESLGSVAIGTFIGIALAAATTRLAASLLYGVSPTDPLTLLLTPALLLLAACAAAYPSARRATRIDPASALRVE